MFTVHCPHHGGRVLLGAGCIESLTSTPDGFLTSWRCHCGTRGTSLVRRSGRPAPATRLAS